MPDILGSLLSLRATGRVGGHRRGWSPPPPVAEEEPPVVIEVLEVQDTSGFKAVNWAAWQDLDAVNLTLTIPNASGWYLLIFQATIESVGGLVHAFLDLAVDGVRVGGGWGLSYELFASGGIKHPVHMVKLVELSGTDVVVRPQAKRVPSNQFYIWASAGLTPACFAVLGLG